MSDFIEAAGNAASVIALVISIPSAVVSFIQLNNARKKRTSGDDDKSPHGE
ncbi:hypothetical protein [Acrocarpospora pleiomorpha]|uniref:hypothetical protein n=1 Tax=Acrocarpospora pleiomorpha TaxID=90975 RepID=UPI0012D2B255|nr:hypothetical protein [Acrocarpospora pleiomorpha]